MSKCPSGKKHVDGAEFSCPSCGASLLDPPSPTSVRYCAAAAALQRD